MKKSLKKVWLFLLISLFVVCVTAFAACKQQEEKPDTPPQQDHERVEYDDEYVGIDGYSVSVKNGEGYRICELEISDDGIISFRLEVFDGYSRDSATVKANGSAVSGEGGSYSVKAPASKTEITVDGVVREYCFVRYVEVKGVSYDGENRVKVGENLVFAVNLSEKTILTDEYGVYAGSEKIEEAEGKYEIKNLTEDIEVEVKGVDYPRHSVTVPQGEGYAFTVNSEEIYDGDELRIGLSLEKEYIKQSNPRVYAGEKLLTMTEDGYYSLKNVTEDVVLSVEGLVKERLYTVSFYNTKEEYEDRIMQFGDPIGAIPDPEWEKLSFKGWLKDGEIVNPEDIIVTEDVKLVAKWNAYAKDEDSEYVKIYEFTNEEVDEIGANFGIEKAVAANRYGKFSEPCEWQAFRVQNAPAKSVYNVKLPAFDFAKYGYVTFRIAAQWGSKSLIYNGVTLGSSSNGKTFDNYTEFFVADGYVGCGNVKTAIPDEVYRGEESLDFTTDEGNALALVFSDFYSYEFDYAPYAESIAAAGPSTSREEAETLIRKYELFKNVLTPYDKDEYGNLEVMVQRLKNSLLPIDLCTDGSMFTVTLDGENKNPNNENDKNVFAEGAKRWTLNNVSHISLAVAATKVEDGQKLVFKIGFEHTDFPTIKIGDTVIFTANQKYDKEIITITLYSDGRVTAEGSAQGIGQTAYVSEAVTGGEEALVLEMDKPIIQKWCHLNVCKTVTLDKA